MVAAMPSVSIDFFLVLGVAGALLNMANYLRLVLQRTSADQPGYFFLNLVASALLLISLSQAFNLGAALFQGFFFIMSLIGLVHRLHLIRRLARQSRNHAALRRL